MTAKTKPMGLLSRAEKTQLDVYIQNTQSGFLARFGEWVGLRTDASEYAKIAAGLTALSLSAGDTVVLPPLLGASPTYMNLYVLLVGPSTVMRKTTVLNMIRQLQPLSEVTGNPFVEWVDDTSIQAFNRVMAHAGKQQVPVILNTDEIAGLFQQVRRPGSYLSAFDKLLLRAYDHSPVEIRRVKGSVAAPAGAFVAVFAASTPEPLVEALTSEDVASGLLPRFMVFNIWRALRGDRLSLLDRQSDRGKWESRRDELREFLAAVATRATAVPTGENPDGTLQFPQTVIRFTQPALRRLDRIDEAFYKAVSADTSAHAAIRGRAFGHIVKLSGLAALSRVGLDTEVELGDVLWASNLVESTSYDLDVLVEEVGSTPFERQINQALERLRHAPDGRVHGADMARHLTLQPKDFKAVLMGLVERELVDVEKDGPALIWQLL